MLNVKIIGYLHGKNKSIISKILIFVRATYNVASPALTFTTKAWLDSRPARSVVYASFGSIAEPSAFQVAEVAEGLYNCGKPFLWVVRPQRHQRSQRTSLIQRRRRDLL
jgi:hypothetical protein